MEKAILCTYDYYKKKDGPDKLTVQFNPDTYMIKSGNAYDVSDKAFNSDYRGFRFAFTKRNPAVLTADLLFDTYLHGEPAAKQRDVRKEFSLLRKFLVVQPDRHTPMVLKFAWASLLFIGVVTDVTETYTMFADNGIPVRAKVQLVITGCREEDLTGNPNESPDRTKLRTVCQKDTLWELAEREYGSGEQWRVIALANGIENPRRLTVASRLILPALPGGEA